MSQDRVTPDMSYSKLRISLFVILVIAIISGGIVLALRQWNKGKPLEIVLPSTSTSTLEIYLSGAVANEGIYTFSRDSSIGDVLQGAGGVTEEVDTLNLKIRVLYIDESPFEQPQEVRININTATTEELQTLYGIGPVKAQAIIDYRNEKGLFHSIEELINVTGIGPETLEKIRYEITVVD